MPGLLHVTPMARAGDGPQSAAPPPDGRCLPPDPRWHADPPAAGVPAPVPTLAAAGLHGRACVAGATAALAYGRIDDVRSP